MALNYGPENGIFILSCPRSGSTMLRHIVDGHRAICSPDELELGRLIHHLRLTVERTIGRTYPPAERESRIREEQRAIIGGLMAKAASRRGKRYWCEKTPDDTEFISPIMSVFPDALYVCLYRNCMDVVNSILDRARHGVLLTAVKDRLHDSNIIDASIRLWTEYAQRLLQLERNFPEQTHRVRYEDIVFSSRETLQELFGFLQVEWYESLSTDGIRDEHEEGDRGKVLGTSDIRNDRVGKGSRVTINLIGRKTRERMNETLQTLGYPPVEDDFNVTHSPYVPKEYRTVDRGTKTQSAVREDQIQQILQRRLTNNPSVTPIPASIKVVIDDIPTSVWTVDLAKRRVERNQDKETDCTIALHSSTLMQIAEGALNTTDARVNDQLRFRGNEEIAKHLGKLF